MASKLIVLATATGCIAAAGVGSYLAVRTAPSGLAAPAAIAAPATNTSESASDITTASDERADAPSTRPAISKQDSQAPEPARQPAVRTPPVTATVPAATEPHAPPAVVASESPALADSSSTASTATAEVTPSAPPATSVVVDTFEEVELPRESVIGIRIETPVSTERNKVEDTVTARLARDVKVEGRTIIPAGTQIIGHITAIERGGRVRERARLGVRFTALVLDDRTRLPIDTPVIFREGEAKTGESSAKIGASAVIGGILGGIVGGKRGAAIGGAAGAAGGTAVVMSGDRSEASLSAGTTLTLRLAEPLVVRVDTR